MNTSLSEYSVPFNPGGCSADESRSIRTFVFDGHYRQGQEVSLCAGEDIYIYEVADCDIQDDDAQTQANVARGMLAALINGGFDDFLPSRASLVANMLSVMGDQESLPSRRKMLLKS